MLEWIKGNMPPDQLNKAYWITDGRRVFLGTWGKISNKWRIIDSYLSCPPITHYKEVDIPIIPKRID